MKKLLSLAMALLMIVTLTACGGTATTSRPKVTLWATGSQNVEDAFTAALNVYNAKEDRKADVELQFILSGTGDQSLSARLAAAYKSGTKNSGFDIIAENGNSLLSYSDEAGSEDVFMKIDTTKLSNFANVLMKPSVLTDKLVPYRGTTVVFAYDSAKLPNPPQTWDELVSWCKANPGKFTYNTPDSGGAGNAFVNTAIYRLISDSSARTSNDVKWEQSWDAGFKWLAALHPYLYQSGGHVQYPVKNQGALDLLGSGEIWLTPAWVDGTLSNIKNGTLPATVKMYQLTDGALSGTDVDFAMPSIGSNPDACYDVINFMISVEGQQLFVDQMYAVPVIDASKLQQTDAVKAVSSLKASDFASISIGALNNDIRTRWTQDILPLAQ